MSWDRPSNVAEVAPYGSWRSPIEPATVARGGRRLGGAKLAADGAVWWAEGRPEEGGRSALMRKPAGGAPEEVTPAGANVRTRVHQYGGGAWKLLGPELVVYTEFADQRLYRLELGGEPVAIGPEPDEPAALRYADFELTPDGKTLFCVREVHDGGPEPENSIVGLTLDGSTRAEVVAHGRDFYSYPRVSPDGLWLAYTCWDHPNMPWDETELWVAPAHDPGAARPLAAGKGESVFAPAWDTQDRLRFVSDRDGWWNLYRTVADLGSPDADRDLPRVEQLSAEHADLGHPQWVFGMQTHAELADGTIVVIRTEAATERVYALEPGGGALRDLGLPFTSFGAPSLSAQGMKVAFAAASPAQEPVIAVIDLAGGAATEGRQARRNRDDPHRLRGDRRRGPRLVPAGGRVPERRRRHRARLLLPAGQRRVRRPRGRTTAADRGQPRRADRARDPGARPRVPLLDQPRLRRRRRELPRLERLRARLPGETERDLGRGRHRGLRRRRDLPCRDR